MSDLSSAMEVDKEDDGTPKDPDTTLPAQDQDGEPQHEGGLKKNEEGYLEDEDGGFYVDGLYITPPPPAAEDLDINGPRLIITHIECVNFKSYAGKQVLGPFHKSFTSIVGPNGSGKSNVIDSMLFVFGYRAQKIRSKKISVLIHDSEKFPDVRSCCVKVFFQEIIDKATKEDPDLFEEVPDSKFVVSRTAFKDNSSYYEVNGRKVQFKEVAKLLRKKGVDLDHNRFLILQGEVEQIALMKPKAQNENDTGMLEFLEDIIGSSRFKEPIEVLNVRFGELDDHRTEKLNRVKLVEKEKDALEKPKDEAMNFLRELNNITHKTDVLCQLRIYLSEVKIEETKAQQKEFEKNSTELLEKLKAITEKKEEKESFAKEQSTSLEQLTKELESAQESFKKHELEDAKLLDEMRTTNVKRKKAIQMCDNEKKNLEKLKEIPEVNRLKIEECNQLREKLEGQLVEEKKKYDVALEGLKAETQEFQDKKEQLETQLIGLQKDENEKESRYNVSKNELDLLKSTEQKEQVKLEQLKQKAITSKNQLKEKEAKQAEHIQRIPELEEQIEVSKAEIEKLTNEYEASFGKVNNMRANVEETRSKQSAIKQGGQVQEALMRQKRSGAIPGILGRLGDLGAIDKKYDVAVSTAIGGGLDRIIVDTVETATKCLEFLKANNVGRVNMLALRETTKFADKVNAQYQTPENVPRLIDLIKVQDESLKTAFYHYAHETLVAENMEQASRIAYGAKRYRVVTLIGDMIETSGAMAGGGKSKMSGKMGTQVVATINEADLRKVEQSLAEEEAKLKDLHERKTGEEHKYTMAKRELADRTRQSDKLKLDLTTLREERNMLKDQIVAQQKIVDESHPDEERVSEMEERVEQLMRELETASENSREIKEGVNKLSKKIKDIQNNKVKSVQAKLDNVNTQLDKVKKEITRLEVECKSSDRNLKKSKDKIDTYETEITEMENKMREAKQEREALVERGQAIKTEIQAKQEKQEELEGRLKASKEELKTLEKEENTYKSERIEFDQVAAKFEAAIRDNNRNAQHWKRERHKLQLEEIPGEDKEELALLEIEELQKLDQNRLEAEINIMKEATSSKRPDLNVIEEYRQKEKVYMERVSELEEITNQRDNKKKDLEHLKKVRLNNFMEGFSKITGKLKEMYQMITLGGDAELELVDSLDPFTEGIVFSVRPPKKSWKNISNLSGGEKTLSSLALVFALHYYKPTPLYVMDEIDAALDFKNVSIVACYIKERTKNAQFIIISLRSNMFELADRLVGIYKTYNATKSVTINPGKIIKE